MTEAAEEAVLEQTDEQANDDLSAGFAEVHGKPSPEADQVRDETPAAVVKEEPAPAQAAAEAPVDEPRIFGMTEAEFKTALGSGEAKAAEEVRKAFSKIGEMNRTVQDLAKRLSAGGSASRKFTADQLKRVNEELPGLGDALAQDLADIFASPAAEAEAQQAKDDPALMNFETRIENALKEVVLSFHGDFDQVCVSPEFGAWLKTLPAERQKSVVESNSPAVAIGAVTEFKTWKDAQATSLARSKTRQERAVPASSGAASSGTPTQDEDAELAAGFGQVSRVRL